MPPERKYAAEKEPAFPDCFALVRRASARPAVDVLKLLDAAIINLIVGNADAHGKNFSLLYGGEGGDLLRSLAKVGSRSNAPHTKIPSQIAPRGDIRTEKSLYQCFKKEFPLRDDPSQ